MKDKDLERKTANKETAGVGAHKQSQPAKTALVEEAPARQEPSAPPAGPSERRFRQTDLPAHFIERRKHPLIKTEQPPPPAPPCFAASSLAAMTSMKSPKAFTTRCMAANLI